jgi:hypothetical protein
VAAAPGRALSTHVPRGRAGGGGGGGAGAAAAGSLLARRPPVMTCAARRVCTTHRMPYAPKKPKPEFRTGLYVVKAPGLVTHGGVFTIPPGCVLFLGGHAAEKHGERVQRVDLRELLALDP